MDKVDIVLATIPARTADVMEKLDRIYATAGSGGTISNEADPGPAGEGDRPASGQPGGEMETVDELVDDLEQELADWGLGSPGRRARGQAAGS